MYVVRADQRQNSVTPQEENMKDTQTELILVFQPNAEAIFEIQGFGRVGIANLLYGTEAITEGEHFLTLKVGETCSIRTKGGKLERVTRIS